MKPFEEDLTRKGRIESDLRSPAAQMTGRIQAMLEVEQTLGRIAEFHWLFVRPDETAVLITNDLGTTVEVRVHYVRRGT